MPTLQQQRDSRVVAVYSLPSDGKENSIFSLGNWEIKNKSDEIKNFPSDIEAL